MSVHDGHRARVRGQFLENGLDVFSDHQVLELLLFYAKPRGDVNVTAHELMDRFGSLAAVFNAPFDQLLLVGGVGENAASLIRLVPQLARRYQMSQEQTSRTVNSSKAAGEYLMPSFVGMTEEVVYVLCLDAKGKVLGKKLLSRGGISAAAVSPRKVVETALAFHASGVILAHNHTSGIALPSKQDVETTRLIASTLCAMELTLVDHIIVADNDFVSMADCGYLD